MTRAKVTVTIYRDLVEWVDGEVSKRTFRNRSHGFEVALARLAESRKGEEA
jgi:Arc/MetJ-type ribon-helix-helix transcriptional regulator